MTEICYDTLELTTCGVEFTFQFIRTIYIKFRVHKV